jgi:hypothetical protein
MTKKGSIQRLALFTMGMLISHACHANSLQQLVQVLAAPAGGWARVSRLPGIAWAEASPRQTPLGHARHGTFNLEGLGQVSVHFTGSRAGPRQASLLLPEGVGRREFSTTLHRLIPLAQVDELQGGCKDDGELAGSAVYRLELPGSAAVYAWLVSSTRGADVHTELTIARQIDERWKCAP